MQPIESLIVKLKQNNAPADYIQYYVDLQEHLLACLENNQDIYATHGFCPDGGISGAILRHMFPKAGIIPLDYGLLKDPETRKNLQQLPWQGIVDLEAFNTNVAEFWIDHHQTPIGKPFSAKQVIYDVEGQSGAWQLYHYTQKYGIGIPFKLKLLAQMTRITDTAGYTVVVSPPTEKVIGVTANSYTIEYDEYDKKHQHSGTVTEENQENHALYEDYIWIMQDIWAVLGNDYQKWQNTINDLAIAGMDAVHLILDDINQLREEREATIEFADSLDANTDMLVYIFKEGTLDKHTVMRRLQEQGLKSLVAITETSNGYSMSFRRQPLNLSNEDKKKLQLNDLASKYFDGGGHAGASGGKCNNVEDACIKISEWCAERDYNIIVHDLRSVNLPPNSFV